MTWTVGINISSDFCRRQTLSVILSLSFVCYDVLRSIFLCHHSIIMCPDDSIYSFFRWNASSPSILAWSLWHENSYWNFKAKFLQMKHFTLPELCLIVIVDSEAFSHLQSGLIVSIVCYFWWFCSPELSSLISISLFFTVVWHRQNENVFVKSVSRFYNIKLKLVLITRLIYVFSRHARFYWFVNQNSQASNIKLPLRQ